MNPLFLLFGLFGAGVFSLLGSNQSTTTTSTAATKPPQSPPTTGEEPEEPAPAPEVPVGQQPEPKPEPVPEPEDPVGQQPEPKPEPVPEPEDPVGQQPEPAPEPEEPVSQQPSAPQPEPEPTPTNPTPVPPEQTGGGGDAGGETAPLAATGTHSVYAGRVATFEPVGDDGTSVLILDGVNHGTLTVNPGNTMALVMTQSDFTGSQSFRYEATHTDGSTSTQTVNLNIQPGLQGAGWGTGENHYMLATDADDRVIVEHGEVHTKVYVSGSNDALSVAEIAQVEGVSQSSVNGAWLAQNGYGQSEDLALDESAGLMLWNHVTPHDAGISTSNWLLLERGYEYDGLSRVLRGVEGESELHPVYMGAWGEGERPELTTQFISNNESVANAVIQDIHFSNGFTLNGAENVIIDSSQFTNDESAIMSGSGVTIRNSDYTDIFRQQSLNGGNWEAGSDRIQAIDASNMDGLLLEGSLFDHTGWEEGYDYYGSGSSPQWPSMFSHNVYIDNNNLDVTVRDIITMRASSFGLKVRSGGFIEDNVILDNNIGVEFLGGDFYGAGNIGEYTLFADNLVTSGAYKHAERVGARAWGVDASGELSSLVDNIIAHMADPDNPAEIAAKTGHSSWGYQNRSGGEYYYDDTIVYNWAGNTNLGDLDTSALDQTTIQLFTEQLLGAGNGTIEDLANFLRAQAADGMYNDTIDADAIIAWFQQGFGLYEAPRSAAETVRFIPNDLGDGVRWDNRLNWTTNDLPGSVAGDSADLGGNTVIFNGNVTIDELEFGPSGRLELYGGRLTAEGMATSGSGGEVLVSDAGQLWADGHEGDGLDIDIVGG